MTSSPTDCKDIAPGSGQADCQPGRFGPSSSVRQQHRGHCGAYPLREAPEARCRETRFAAKPAPKANRKTGPNVLAAAVPTKYNPGTDDSKCDDRIGAFSTWATPSRILLSRKLNLRRSTRYP